MKTAVFISLGFVLLGASSGSHAPVPRVETRNVFGADDRILLPDWEAKTGAECDPAWESVGCLIVDTKTREMNGTGTLIAPDLVLTAAHCLIDPKTKTFYDGKIMFHKCLRNDDRYDCTESAYVVEIADIGSMDPERDLAHDWAVVRLDRELACTPLQIAGKLEKEWLLAAPLTLIGYSTDLAKGRTPAIHAGCRIAGFENGCYLHDGDAYHGASGGPLLATIGDRTCVIGMHVASKPDANGKLPLHGVTFAPEIANIAVESNSFAERCAACIAGRSKPGQWAFPVHTNSANQANAVAWLTYKSGNRPLRSFYGTLVGRNLVLTVADRIVNPKSKQPWEQSLYFGNDGRYKVTNVVAVGTREFGPSDLKNNWALLKLDKDVADAAPLRIKAGLSAEDLRELLPERQMTLSSNRILHSGDPDIYGGDPLVAKIPNEGLCLVGLNISRRDAFQTWQPGSGNSYIRANIVVCPDAFAARLSEILSKQK